MNSLIPEILRPYWLLLLPLLLWLLWRLWQRESRLGRWQTILPVAFHSILLSGGKGQVGRLRWIILGLAWLCALLALLGPSWQRVEQAQVQAQAPLVAIMDMTPRMLAEDTPPSRLEQARRKVMDLLNIRKDAQTALLVYAGSAHTLVPLSNDLSTSRNLVDALKPSIMPEPGARADLAVQRALDLLDQGDNGRGRILLITSSLSDQEQSAIRQILKNRPEKLDILGIGSRDGVPIRNEGGGFLKDADGNILIPKLDASALARFAKSVGGQYQTLRLDDRDLQALGLELTQAQMQHSKESLQLTNWLDQGYWLLIPLLILAACAGRRGWLFAFALLLIQPPDAQAFSFDDLWWKADQQGMQLLEQQRPKEAAERFNDRQWQGVALYQNQDYDAAATRFAEDDSAIGHYNRGNALAWAEQYEAAIDAYDQALDHDPDFAQARSNKALIEELLRQQENQPESSESESEQDSDSSTEQDNPQNQEPKQNTGNNGQQDSQNSDTPNQGQNPSQDQNSGQDSEQTADQSTQQPEQGQDQEPSERSAEQEPNNSPTAPQQSPAQSSEQQGQDELNAGTMQTPEFNPNQNEGQPSTPAGEEILESQQAREQWLRQISDDPAELLRRKFWYEQQQRQERTP